ncbi:hypothetical protein BDW22DRAFT_1487322 [Trametopsis cervina]|nr:hypothetical protein BDW22DRAFT_1487322 [Trametopsis cervina]
MPSAATARAGTLPIPHAHRRLTQRCPSRPPGNDSMLVHANDTAVCSSIHLSLFSRLLSPNSPYSAPAKTAHPSQVSSRIYLLCIPIYPSILLSSLSPALNASSEPLTSVVSHGLSLSPVPPSPSSFFLGHSSVLAAP